MREGYRRNRGRHPIPIVGRSSAVKSPEMVCQRLAHGSLVSIYSIPDPDPPCVILPPASVRHLVEKAGVGVSSCQPELARPLPPILFTALNMF